MRLAKNKGFTLIELLVVIAIISLLSSIVLSSLNSVRMKARDATRLSDMRQIQLALDLYLDSNGQYPDNTDTLDCAGWDVGYVGGSQSGDLFIEPLQTGNFISKTPGDPTATGACGGYRYYRYGPGTGGCDSSRGRFYVLSVVNMETSVGTHPSSPGWSCSTNWQTGVEWVTGKFEK